MISFSPLQIKKIQGQLEQIKNDLISSCRRDETGVYWQSPYYESADQFVFKTTFDIFNGNSGIALFYIGLFEFSGKREDLKMAEDVMNKVLQSEDVISPKSFGFYTGLTGVAYVCIKLYEHNQEEKYLRTASRLMLDNQENIFNNTAKADFLSGYSGSLLVITLLYHHLRTKNLLAIIRQLIDRIISEARISETGLKWDYNQSKSAFDSLAGFSHGASGIAYVLMQVGNYFKDEGLIYLGEQALAYEMQYFHAESGNWLDLRLGKYRLSLPDAYKWDLNIFLPEMKKVNSWAHGAAGIGLARLFAYKITGNELYFRQCKLVMQRCLKDLKELDRTDFTLCSGYAGILLFVSEFSGFMEKDYSTLFMRVMDQAKTQYERKRSYNTYISANQFDYGLLSGKAGAGYMLLQLLNKEMNNAVYPVLPRNQKMTTTLVSPDKSAIQHHLFSTHYARTIHFLNTYAPGFTDQLQAENVREFEEQVLEKIGQLSNDKDHGGAEIFCFENKMAAWWKRHKGYLCYQKKNEYILNKAKQLSLATDEELCNLSFKLQDHVFFYSLGSRLKELMVLAKTHQAVLFIAEPNGVSPVYIGQLSALLISRLDQQSVTGKRLISLIIDSFLENEQLKLETTVLKERIILQIRSLVMSGIIGMQEEDE
ncbi:hypothetical protein HDE68_004488 [Pedobacter cryoconitis]|uniref:Lanthionine synthetase-like protein n=1 Tax=Pedobacter cryoconitis TaxID=188932 RepID=A0A7W9E0Z1_9SPHI|nr:lanthionine synthetase LanC family protein [Pedobacter cryoconitis]MBB5638556.1 hypothetical protein [Pedobacter cryoconitis]